MTAIDNWIADIIGTRGSAQNQPIVGSVDLCVAAWQQVLAAIGGGVGTVTSVGLALPTNEFSVSGSPVTTSGTLTGAWKTQNANTTFAGPSSGAPATPSFRALAAADIPSTLSGSILTIGASGTSPGFFVQITGDTGLRTGVRTNSTDVGTVSFGSGTGSSDAFLERVAAANLRLGQPDSAAPVAQTLSVQNVVAGTTDTAGQALTINGSRGTGAGAGGTIVFNVAPATTTGSTQNPLTPALTLNTDATASFPTTINARALSFSAVSASVPNVGMYESSSNVVAITTAGSNRLVVTSTSVTVTGNISGQNASSWFAINSAASATQPTLVPNQSNLRAGIGADAAGDLSLIADNSGTPVEMIRVTGTGVTMRTAPFGLKSFTVGTLPSAASFAGGLCYVSDSTLSMTAAIGAVLAGGGANVVPAFSDGTNWRGI